MHIQGAHAIIQQIMQSSDKHLYTTLFDTMQMHVPGMSSVGDPYQ